MASDNIKTQIETLVKLQKIETESDIIRSKLDNVSERLKTLDASLEEFERTIEEQAALTNELKKKYRDRESDFKMNLDREKKIQAKLGSVKTNKEYQSLLKEIEDAKTINSAIEDEMIEYLDRIDEVDKEVISKKDEYLQLADQIKNEKDGIIHEEELNKKKLAELDCDRQGVASKVNSEWLKKYLLIKERNKSGFAIVQVKDAVCYGCNVNLPPQLYNELHRCDTLKFCPNCQRIIYWKG